MTHQGQAPDDIAADWPGLACRQAAGVNHTGAMDGEVTECGMAAGRRRRAWLLLLSKTDSEAGRSTEKALIPGRRSAWFFSLSGLLCRRALRAGSSVRLLSLQQRILFPIQPSPLLGRQCHIALQWAG